MRQLQKNIQPIKVGYFKYTLNDDTPDKICFEDDYKGFIKIYEEPIIGHPYVIGGDTSGEGSDFFTATVVDNYTGYTVATLKFQFDEDLYACQMFCLGHYYNYALIGIEANFSSYPIKLLEKMGYDNMFIRITEDNYTEKPMRSFGFRTTVKTRPIIISNLVKMVRETPELFVDKQTLEEFLTFVRDESGKPVAQLGKHDDLVMSTAIAYYLYIGDQQSHTIDSKHISRINTNAHFWAKELEEDEEGEYIEWD
jgi:phage terminase large subunit